MSKVKARILRSGKRIFTCEMIDNKTIVEAPALATLLKEDHIVVGDFVMLEKIDSKSSEWQIIEVVPRKNEIFRLIPREQKKKVTAANCDVLVVVTSVSRPEYKRGMIDRYLVRAREWNIPTFLVFNKMDEFDDETGPDLHFEKLRLNGLDVECFEVSSVDLNYETRFFNNGLVELQNHLKNKTAVVLGHSGVGKSKLISLLSKGLVNLLSGELGKLGKGAHTTTWAEIVNCGDFYLIDSPGVRSLALDDLLVEDLEFYFPDLFEISKHCKFRNCEHLDESKGCAFFDLNEEDEKTEMILSRLESFLKFKDELSKRPTWDKIKN